MALDSNGTPTIFIDADVLRSQATALAFNLAVAAGDHAAAERVADRFLDGDDSRIGGVIAAAALAVLAHRIIAPLVSIVEKSAPHVGIRDVLRASLEDAERLLSGGGAA
ncbi:MULTISPECIES: hypothetical protein [Nocardia]|uniref:hypothetical protein n=1 Tax=Nocardia TaxID=1817 RepID=UPI002453CA1C|nr:MULTISPECIES: hypothetical protein [Nocardia]